MERYPGPRPFTFNDKDIFFGRTSDIENLYDLILLEKIVVLFAKSGVGKSSLINAGLIPRFRENDKIRECVIRLFSYIDDGRLSLVNQVGSIIEHSIINKKVPAVNKNLTQHGLWGVVRTAQDVIGPEKQLLLIFDQFEELFTYPEEQISIFKEQLAEVLYAKMPFSVRYEEDLKNNLIETDIVFETPKIKILCIIRSDRLSSIHRLKDYIPTIFDVTYELLPLNNLQAAEAIRNPAGIKDSNFQSSAFSYKSTVIDGIINYLSGIDKKAIIDEHILSNHFIESFQLQIICQRAEVIVKEKSPVMIEEDFLLTLRNIFESFYISKVEEIGEYSAKQGMRKLLEEKLISVDKTVRISISETEILNFLSEFSPDPKKLFSKIYQTRLVRIEPQSNGVNKYEIAHDTLLTPILNARLKRENDEKSIATIKGFETKILEETKSREKNILSKSDYLVQHLVETIRAEKSILLVGPELCKIGNTSLTEFLKKRDSEDYVYYQEDGLFSTRSALDLHQLERQVKDYYRELRSTEVFDKIADIPFNSIISFSPDHLIFNLLESQNKRFHYHYSRFGYNNSIGDYDREELLVYNFFGDIDDGASLILTHDALFELIRTSLDGSSLTDLRIRLDRSESIVLTGFDFSKWYLQPLLWSFLNYSTRVRRKIIVAIPNSHIESHRSEIITREYTSKFSTLFDIDFIQNSEINFFSEIVDELKDKDYPNDRRFTKKISIGEIESLILEGKNEEAFDRVLNFAETKKNIDTGDLVILKTKFRQLQNEYVKGLLNKDQYTLENTKILDAFIDILRKHQITN